MPVVWIDNNSSSTEDEYPEDEGYDGEVHHWASYGDEGRSEDGGELVTGYGGGARVVMVLGEVRLGKG